MAFTAKILSWRFRHLNIISCLLKRRPTKEGGVTGTPGPPLPPPPATHLSNRHVNVYFPNSIERVLRVLEKRETSTAKARARDTRANRETGF